MSSSLRRFEILLPLRFNDGQAVPDSLIADCLLEVRQQFGAVSSETQTIHGIWSHQGQIYRDELLRIFVDVPDTPESRRFFTDYKDRLKTRLKQIDIWMTTYPIELI
jgi:hypothetical protein